MSLLPLEPLQKLIDIGMVLGYYGVEAMMPSFKNIVVLGSSENTTGATIRLKSLIFLDEMSYQTLFLDELSY